MVRWQQWQYCQFRFLYFYVGSSIIFEIFYFQGDAGGPLTFKSGDQHILIGVVSGGLGCARVSYIYSSLHYIAL